MAPSKLRVRASATVAFIRRRRSSYAATIASSCTRMFPIPTPSRDLVHRFRRRGIAGLLLMWTCAALGATGLPVEFGTRRWSDPDGPPLRSVEAILQTRDGFLWFGLNHGLCRFDGAAFQMFEPRNTPALRVSYVTALAEAADGTLWIGSAGGGLIAYRNGTFTHYGESEGLANEQVRTLLFGRNGSLWIGTDGGGVFVRDPHGRFTHFGQESGLPEPFVMSLARDGRGRIFAATYRSGAFLFEDGRFRQVPLEPPLNEAMGFSLTQSPSGAVWLCTPQGVYRLEEDRFLRWQDMPLPGHEPVVAWQTSESTIWFGTTRGLALWQDGTWTAYPIGGASSSRFASAFTVDPEGGVWTVSEGGGLVQLRRTKVVTLGEEEGLSANEITSVLSSRDGSLWVGTPHGLNRLRGGGIEVFTTADGLPDDFIFSLHEDANGTLWIATRLGGLVQFSGQTFGLLPEAERLPTRGAWCLAGTRDGSVWVGTSRGAFRYHEGRRVLHLNGATGLSNDDVRSITEDADGTIWIGTSHGLNRFRNGAIATFTEIPGAPPLQVVTALHVDSRNDLWIGTLTHGLFRHRNGRFQHLSSRHGLASDTIHSITEDDAGGLWLGSPRGIMRLDKASVDAVASAHTNRLAVVIYGRAAGMRTEDCTGTIQPTVARSADGRLWFATTGGLSTLHPSRIPRVRRPPLVHVETIAIEGPRPLAKLRAQAVSGSDCEVEPIVERGDTPAPAARQRAAFSTTGLQSVRIPPSQDRFEFQYVGLSWVAPEDVRFRYRLENFDRDWVDAGHRRVAYYTRVPPGTYLFRVEATHQDGLTNQPPAALAVIVEPAWWQTVALRVLAGGAVASGLLALVGTRLSRLQRERAASIELSRTLIRSQEAERARLAGELHDGLAQELQIIRNRAELALVRLKPDPQVAGELTAISATAALAIREVRAISRGLRPPELDQLGLTESLRWLARAVATAFPGHVESRIDNVDGLLDRDRELHVFRIAQEALNNAVKHGRAREITLEVEHTDCLLTVCVFDDGEGMRARDSSDPLGGSGLKTMSERAAMLSGTLTIRSEPGAGTRLTLLVPAHKKSIQR